MFNKILLSIVRSKELLFSQPRSDKKLWSSGPDKEDPKPIKADPANILIS